MSSAAFADVTTFQPEQNGNAFGSAEDYGTVDDNNSGNEFGARSFESIGGNGYTFYFYVGDNPGNPADTIAQHPTWGASDLTDDFLAGLTEEPAIRRLEIGERGSSNYGAITETAPDILTIGAWDADSFDLAWNGDSPITNGGLVGWEITVQASAAPAVFGDFSSPTAIADYYNYVNLWQASTDTFATSGGDAILESGAGTAGYVWNQGEVLDGVGDKIQGTFSVSAFNRASSAFAHIAAGFGLWSDIDGTNFLTEPSVLLDSSSNASLQGGGGTSLLVGSASTPSSYILTLEVIEVDCTLERLRLNLSISGDYGATSKDIWVAAKEVYFGLTSFNIIGSDVTLSNLSFVDVGAAPCDGTDPEIEIGSDTTTQTGVATLPITLTGGGDEFAISGSVSFDPAVFSNPQFTLGADAPANMTLTENLGDAAQGHVGFLLGLPFGETFAAGSNDVLQLQLTVSAQASKTVHVVTFGDTPSFRDVVNDLAETITATWADGSVNVINRDPVATDDQENTDEDTTFTVAAPGVLSNDSDPDFGDVLSVIPVSATTPGGASISINSDGSISYDPTASSTLNALPFGTDFDDTVDYTIDDGDGGSDTATLQVTVAGVNDAPTAADDDNVAATDENVTLTVLAAGVLTNDSDPDTGDTFSVASVDATSANGASITLNGDGSIGYDSTTAPAVLALADGVEMVDSFTYTIEDALGLQDSATVSVTVSGVEFEGDVTPRSSGDNSVNVTDAVMIAKFVLGLESPSAGEFSRADTSPRSSGGNGRLTAADWVQALRYAVGFDSVNRVFGPTAPTGPVVAAQVEARVEVDPGSAKISMVPILNRDGNVELSINMNSTGQVSAVGFSVAFDPAIHRYDEHAFANTTKGATALINTDQANNGRLGVVIANYNVDQTFQDGKIGLLNLNLTTISKSRLKGSIIQFEDFPASKSVSDTNANKIDTEYVGATLGTLVPDSPTVPQTWLSSYFALTDLSDPDKEDTVWGADADPDGDGQPNHMEYAAGTSPIDGKSAFASHIDKNSDSVTISFYPYREDRSYRLLMSDLGDGSDWTEVRSENWQLSTDPSLGEGGSTSIENSGEAGFYRVQVSLPKP